MTHTHTLLYCLTYSPKKNFKRKKYVAVHTRFSERLLELFSISFFPALYFNTELFLIKFNKNQMILILHKPLNYNKLAFYNPYYFSQTLSPRNHGLQFTHSEIFQKRCGVWWSDWKRCYMFLSSSLSHLYKDSERAGAPPNILVQSI